MRPRHTHSAIDQPVIIPIIIVIMISFKILHQLLKLFAESRVAAQGQEPGRGVAGQDQESGALSAGEAGTLAQLGQRQTMALDERQAFAMANQGRGLCRVGRAFIP